MFTGLVQDVGVVSAVYSAGQAVHLHIQTGLAHLLVDGDSLSVNGVCLTLTSKRESHAVLTAIPETLSRSTLGTLVAGARVNLEPALRLDDRLGGHLVQGHVDGMGTVVRLLQRGLSLEMTVETGSDVLRYVVEKGSVAMDGVSLTVATLAPSSFTVALIPHTLATTTLGERRVGDRVNLEVDILAKYVERLISGRPAQEQGPEAMTEEWLRQQGF